MKTVCFTGHRNMTVTPEIKQRLAETLNALIERGAVDFYAGGSMGWDMLCSETVIELRGQNPDIKLNLVLPCPVSRMTAKWSAKQQMQLQNIISLADSIEVTSDKYFYGCTKIRNRRLIELAECCVCYCDSDNYAGGSGQTLLMAERSNLAIFNLAK